MYCVCTILRIRFQWLPLQIGRFFKIAKALVASLTLCLKLLILLEGLIVLDYDNFVVVFQFFYRRLVLAYLSFQLQKESQLEVYVCFADSLQTFSCNDDMSLSFSTSFALSRSTSESTRFAASSIMLPMLVASCVASSL